MEAPFPSPVSTWHNDTYPAISPRRPEIGASGKTIIITGAGGVIGRQTALAFAEAGAKHVALVGRTTKSLEETKAMLPNTTEASTHRADTTDAAELKSLAQAVGTWDVLILSTAYMPKPGYIAASDLDDYWNGFEHNVKSVVSTMQALVPSANPEKAVILGLFAGAIALPTQATAGLSGYLVSKLAQAKLLEYIVAENKSIFAASVHPGMVDSSTFRASGATPDMLPMDNARLPAHFLVWMASEEASELCGKTVWANWDVEELKSVAGKLKDASELTLGAVGWPFSPSCQIMFELRGSPLAYTS